MILSATPVVFAQGDFAPFEQPQKLKKVIPKPRSAAERKAAEKAAKIAAKKAALKKARRDTGQAAKIKVDGSAVYEVANFDSPVLEYLDSGKKAQISKKIYPGIGGLGSFYKIRLRKGVYGFIADTDVERLSGKPGEDRASAPKNNEVPPDEQGIEAGSDPSVLQPELEEGEPEDGAPGDSFYFHRYLGLAYYNINFAEELRKRTEQTDVTMFGLKLSGSTGLLGGLPLDINFLFTATAPDFYEKIASATSGFMLLSDAVVVLPFYESKRVLVHYGLGLVMRFSSWDVSLKNQPGKKAIESQELALGAVGELGAAFRLGERAALRVDARYFYEAEKYLGYGAAFQWRF